MRDSAWERVHGTLHQGERHALLSGSVEQQHAQLKNIFAQLKTRYQQVAQCIEQGWVRAAKDVSEGGLLMSVFEMCLGREMGVHFGDNNFSEALAMLGEGLGGLVLSVDPHNADKVEQHITEAKRLGVVVNSPELHWPQQQLDWRPWRKSYLEKTAAGSGREQVLYSYW